MRVNAAHQALAMWRGDRTKIWRGAEGEQRTLPTVLTSMAASGRLPVTGC
jgi:hypothetical protein